MSPIEQRIAIAKACGYKLTPLPQNPNQKTWQRHGCTEELPDYLTDLNAMHEAEKHMEQSETYVCHDYAENLRIVIYSTNPRRVGEFRLLNATASQRAEAFLKTLGLWKEDAQ